MAKMSLEASSIATRYAMLLEMIIPYPRKTGIQPFKMQYTMEWTGYALPSMRGCISY